MSSHPSLSRQHTGNSTPPVCRSPSTQQPQYYGYNHDLSLRGYHGGYLYPPPPHAEYANYVPYPQYVSEPQTFVIPCATPIYIMHTSDASMKASDLLRRRCFNCCTTETATWRCSKLSAGKLLCNKCGIFERTHSRPRPEQLSYKHSRISKAPPSSSAPQSRYESNQSYPSYPTYSVPSESQYHPQSAAHPPFLLPGLPPPQTQESSALPGTANTASTRPSPVASNILLVHGNVGKPSQNSDANKQASSHS
ncbi:hypothetical protein C8R43DRAFT_132045 [Mycena crocata]|nr:hypothetical protein C8R43DRAFT_132045 [Mycena crocata]